MANTVLTLMHGVIAVSFVSICVVYFNIAILIHILTLKMPLSSFKEQREWSVKRKENHRI